MRKSIVALIIGGVGLAGFALYSYVMKQKNLLEQFTYKITKFKINVCALGIKVSSHTGQT